MGDEASIKARLGLDVQDWRANSKTAGEDVTKFTAKVTEGKAAIAAFEAKMREAGKATADQKKQLSDARSELVKYEQDLRKPRRQRSVSMPPTTCEVRRPFHLARLRPTPATVVMVPAATTGCGARNLGTAHVRSWTCSPPGSRPRRRP